MVGNHFKSAKAEGSLTAVSYTHLDVYKRQAPAEETAAAEEPAETPAE